MLAWHCFDTSCWFRKSLSTNCIVQLFFFFNFHKPFFIDYCICICISRQRGGRRERSFRSILMPKEGNIEGMLRVNTSKSRKSFIRIFFFFFLPPVRDNITYGNHKLCSQLQDSFFIWFYFRCSHICFISYTFFIPLSATYKSLHLYTLQVIGPSACKQKNTSDYKPLFSFSCKPPSEFNLFWQFEALTKNQ